MYAIKFEWKEFSVNLQAVDAWLRTNGGEHYSGNSADTKLTLWFTQEPDPTVIAACEAYWYGVTSASTEATSYVSGQAIKDAVAAIRVDLHTKTWDAMTATERKIVLGQMPTQTELGF